ncbi:hypothetical protein BB559_002843 [Furculomyces boomerangus]|uniref:Uncharacterized protein n=1 Tax=Furculomyces boomerangus TaxID=61424 RepID=A0A2T9YRR8_9FUNG|nr:hypothetical protein BB559_002843 [Furculomyces boomerangus]
MEETELERPLVYEELNYHQILELSFSNWYTKFKKHSLRAEIIDLDYTNFFEYLSSDGIFIPDDSIGPKYNKEHVENNYSDDEWNSDEDSDDSSEETNDSENKNVKFDQTKFDLINLTIKKLGGKVIPRTNWSAPTDSSWISIGNTLRCEAAGQVLLLLKASDKTVQDLITYSGVTQPFTSKSDLKPELVLRTYKEILPSMVFRCFVKNDTLVGISQVDLSYYDFLHRMSKKLESSITRFYYSVIHKKFNHLKNFCFDVFVTTRNQSPNSDYDNYTDDQTNTEKSYKITLLDFDPWYPPKTDSLLFEWEELINIESISNLENNENNACDIKELKTLDEIDNDSLQPLQPVLGLRLFPESLNMSIGSVFNSSKYSQSRFPIELTAESYQKAQESFFSHK